METEPSLVHTGELSTCSSVNEQSAAYTSVLNCSRGLNTRDAEHEGIFPLIVLAACRVTVFFPVTRLPFILKLRQTAAFSLKAQQALCLVPNSRQTQLTADTVYQT